MDKTEYGIKLDQINNFVDKQDFQGALEVVASIDWRRVKSIRTLSMVADIYEANEMLEESKEILLLAYNRTTAGRGILYRLVEISLKLNQIDEAVEYYTEYAKIARGDNTKYLLKYKIYRARSAPLGEQIAILEQYKEKEYTERWAYELAKLYDKADMKDRCIEECDDIVLWFSEGKYVVKAMELKMNYTPLSPSQQERYNNRHIKKPELTESFAEENQQTEVKLQSAAVKQQNADEVNAHQDPAIQEAAATSDDHAKTIDLAKELAYTPEQPLRKDSEHIQEKLVNSFKDVFAGFNKVKEEISFNFSKNNDVVEDEEEDPGDAEEYNVVKDLEPEKLEHLPAKGQMGALKQIVFEPLSKATEAVAEMIEKPKPEQSENEDDFTEVDITRILEETANDLAKQVGKSQVTEAAAGEQSVSEIEEPHINAENSKPIREDAEKAEEMIETADEVPADEAPADEILADEVPAEEALADEVPVDEAPADEILADEVPADEAPADEILADEVPADEVPADNAPADNIQESQEFDLTEWLINLENQDTSAEEKRIHILNATRPEKLTDEQKKLFSYFAKIPGMDQQMLDAMYSVYTYAGDKTSKKGNIAIMGGRGTGKTRLADGLIKAICQDFGMEAVKVARLKGEDLNQKDAVKVVAKLSGGFLLIENAASMNQETIDKLSHAMEFRTDSLIIIIEDEKNNLRRMLKEQESFAKKFGTVISIPVFTNDELVSFSRTYAREMGYKIDEMGVLALYTSIGENQTEEDPFTITQVKELVDGAIQKAQKGTRKLGRRLSARETDEAGCTILYEKDF